MGPADAPLFRLLSARMGWLSQRQAILAQNIANADTPEYRPKDLNAKDFLRLTQGYAGRPTRLSVHKTDAGHLDGKASASLGLAGREQRMPYEVSPDGNAVILERANGEGWTDRSRPSVGQQYLPKICRHVSNCAWLKRSMISQLAMVTLLNRSHDGSQ